MSFNIVLGKNTSPSNSLNKTITVVTTLTGNLRNETEIINPIILIESTENIHTCNYLSISAFSRYYFITSIKLIRSGLYEIKAHCDVLYSFREEILSNKCQILRQENNFNLLLSDDVFKCKQNNKVVHRKFPSQLGQFNYILTVAGGN